MMLDFSQWVDEAQRHGQQIVATVAAAMQNREWFMKAALSIAVIAATSGFSSWLTAQITLARVEERFEERFKAVNATRDILVAARDSQIRETKVDIEKLETYMKLFGDRQIEVITRLHAIENRLDAHERDTRRQR